LAEELARRTRCLIGSSPFRDVPRSAVALAAGERESVPTSGGPRVDDTAVYYFHNGAVLRRLK
jgi:hypothetical protein